MRYQYHGLLAEKVAAEHPLTHENLEATVEPANLSISMKELAASNYERVRNALAKAMSEFGSKEVIHSLSTNHGKYFRLLDLGNEEECKKFLEHCSELERHLDSYISFLREERWYNSEQV